MSATVSHPPSAAAHEPRRFSGRIFVFAFLGFVIVGSVVAMVLAERVRPAAMEAHAKALPLSGTMKVTCLGPAGPHVMTKGDATCSTAGKLEFSLPDPGIGIKSMTWALLSRSPQETPLTGQFEPKGGTAQVDLHSVVPEYHVAVFVYSDVPVSLPAFTAALNAVPAGNVPEQIKAIERYANGVIHQDPGRLHELRTARVELKIVSG